MSKNIYKDLIIQDYKGEFDLIEAFIREASNLKDSKEYDNVSVYGKKDFIYDIFKLLITDYDFEIGSIDFSREYFDEEYGCEYCLRVFDDLLLVVEKAYDNDFKPYAIDGISFMYQEDCSQTLIDNALNNDAKVVLFGIGKSDKECECSDEQPCKELADKSDISLDKDGFKVTVKCDLDADEALEIIKDMENRMVHINDIFREMDNFRRLFHW